MAPRDPVEPEAHGASRAPAADASAPGVPVVGIGASAGALDSLRRLFGAAPADTPLAFVVVTHMSPEHESLLAELLGSRTPLPVHVAEEGMEVRAGHVHVIPPNVELTLRQGRLHLEPRSEAAVPTPVDVFLRSLAADRGADAVAVVLSGTGSDGARGARHVKEAGGSVVVESPESAEYPFMPDHVAEAVPPDLVLPAQDIVTGILDLLEHRRAARDRLEEPGGEGAEDRLLTIFRTLAAQVGHDFTGYKRGTLIRRVQRRMATRRIRDPERYAELVATSADEAQALFQDVLIGVTGFFRDPEAFRRLGEVGLPALVREEGLPETVRAWVPACSSGEEAYSVAMLLMEFLGEGRHLHPMKVFATDVDSEALARARVGSYPEAVIGDLGEERARRFFLSARGRVRVRPSVRSHVVFALHDLVRDAPFSRLDLISCRNLLIYLSRDLQQRILRLFHHALRPGGILFLGAAESLGSAEELFEPLDARARIFRRRAASRRVVPPEEFRSWATLRDPESVALREDLPGRALGAVEEQARSALLRRYGPPAVVVDSGMEVVFHSTRGLGLLAPPVGAPTGQLLKLLPDGLRPAVRSTVRECLDTGKAARYKGILVEEGEGRRRVDVVAEPLDPRGSLRDLVLVSFEVLGELGSSVAPREDAAHEGASAAQRDGEEEGDPSWDMVQRLEEQLDRSRDELSDTIERLETANDELTGFNEELVSMNEELLASNEELEASKEELQAVNEELLAVNAELEDKVAQLARTNDDMSNLIVSSHAATLFLDRDLRIQRLTPAAGESLDLDAAADRGRPARLLAGRLGGVDVEAAAREVLESHRPARLEATTRDGRHLSLRLRPYRTAEDVVEGVALSLFDVTELEETRSRLAAERVVLDAILQATDVALAYLDRRLRIVTANGAYAELCDLPVDALEGSPHQELFRDPALERELRAALREDRAIRLTDVSLQPPPPGREGETFWDVGIQPVRAGELRPSGLIVTVRETTDRVRTLAELRESEERHRLMGEIIPYGVWLTDAQGKPRYISPSWQQMTGLTLEDAGQSWAASLQPEGRAESLAAWQESLETGKPFEREIRYASVDGDTRVVLSRGLPIRDAEGAITGWAGINLDITAQKAAEAERLTLAAEVERARRLSALGVVSAGVAHEFNNLLAIFMGAADLLLEEPADPETVRECAWTVLATAGRGRSVVSQIMSVGRPPDPQPEPVAVARLVDRVVQELRLSRDGEVAPGLDVEVEEDPGAPPAWTDRDHLTQVLHNLVDNADRSMREAGRPGRVRVRVGPGPARGLPRPLEGRGGGESGWIRIQVSDDGPGIPPEVREEIFQPFFTTRPTGQGTGLGLPVARSLVLANGGWLGLGEGEAGAVFEILLPTAPAGREGPAPAAEADGGGAPHGEDGLAGRRIVVVDDERELVRLLVRALERAGFACEGFHRSGEALDRLRGDPDSVDLLISDAKMPGIPGARLVREVRDLRPGLPVILYSGQDELEGSELEGLAVDRLLTKPVPLGGVVAAVRELLGDAAG